MFSITGLRHNRFQVVDIPKAKTLYQRLGFGKGSEKTSGEEFLDPSEDKVKMAQNVQRQVDRESKEAEEALNKSA